MTTTAAATPVPATAPTRPSYMAAAASQCTQVVDKVAAEVGTNFVSAGTHTTGDLAVAFKQNKVPFTFEMTPSGDAVVRQKAPHPAATVELARRLSAMSSAFKNAQYADQLCNTWAVSVAVQLKRDAGVDLELERANTPAVLAAVLRADALAASTTGLLAALGTVGKGTDPKAVDELHAALAKALSVRPAPTAKDVDAFWAFATTKATELKDIAPAPQLAEKRSQGPVLDLDPADATKAKRFKDDPNAVKEAALGLFRQDYNAAMRGVVVLFPSEAPVRQGLGAANALTHNDFKGALKLARKMVTADSDVGKALATISR